LKELGPKNLNRIVAQSSHTADSVSCIYYPQQQKTEGPGAAEKGITTTRRIRVFLGKGSSKTRGKELSALPKTSPGKCFSGGIFFREDFAITKKNGIVRLKKNPGHIKYELTDVGFLYAFCRPLRRPKPMAAGRRSE
jgi:hypothetical protein